MATQNFTTRWLDSLKPPAEGQADWFDERTSGLGLRISAGGRRAWFVKYAVHGRQRRVTFGTYPQLSLQDARQTAIEMKGKAQKGIDAVAERRAAREAAEAETRRLTFKALADLFIERHGKVKKRSWREDQRIIDVYFADWHKRAAGSIKRGEVSERMHAIASKNGPIQANRCLAVVRKVYNWALATDTGGIEGNPAHKLPAPGAETERDRVYTDDEIKRLWAAFDAKGVHGCALKLALVTGQRIGEVCRLTWAEIDEAATSWTLPAGRSKNRRAHVVPLSDLARDILAGQKGLDDALVFPSPSRAETAIVNGSKMVVSIRTKAEVADFRAHDLRRTAATNMTALGHSRFVVDRVLNHTEPGVGRVYDRYAYLAEKRAALDSWALRLRELLKLGGNVVPLKTA